MQHVAQFSLLKYREYTVFLREDTIIIVLHESLMYDVKCIKLVDEIEEAPLHTWNNQPEVEEL